MFKRFLTIIAIISLYLPIASAQTPTPHPDIILLPIGGIYPVKCLAPPDVDVAQICCVRVDTTPVDELGCIPAGPNEIVTLDMTIVNTPDDDAEIRCYAVDTSTLKSDLSDNAGLVDFTRPGKPVVQ